MAVQTTKPTGSPTLHVCACNINRAALAVFCPSAQNTGEIGLTQKSQWACMLSVTTEQNDFSQEPITYSLQLPHISIKAFSQIDLFLDRIFHK